MKTKEKLYFWPNKIASKMPTTKATEAKPNKKPQSNTIPESRLIEGTAPTGVKMSDLIKKGWKKDAKRMTADEIRKKAWQRNHEK